MPEGSIQDDLINRTQELLDAIAARDWATYERLTDPTLTCFEPEAPRQLVEGLDFHRFYLSQDPPADRPTTTLVRPHVRLLGDCAVVSYVRLIQSRGADAVQTFAETRVWSRASGFWKQVHFHRS